MEFKDLSPGWKALSVLGIIFALLCVALAILVVLMFETDLIPWPVFEPDAEEIQDEFGDFLQEFEYGGMEEPEYYKHEVKDLEGNPMLDLLHIEVYEE